jgi:hypothetical protein
MEHSSEQPLIEPAPEEAVVRALAQSAYPAEFVESNRSEGEVAEA